MAAAAGSRRTRRNVARAAAQALAEEIALDVERWQRPPRRSESLLVLRKDFVQVNRSLPGNNSSPLTQLMGPTKGWSHGTAAKLYLTLLWLSSNIQPGRARPVELTPARTGLLADTVGITRRVTNDQLRSLQHRRFVQFLNPETRNIPNHDNQSDTQPVLVRGTTVCCLSELGDGQRHHEPNSDELWFSLGPGLFTEGWMAELNGAALAVLLVMTSRIDNYQPTAPIWIASSKVAEWFGFSHPVWKRGISQLCDHGLFHPYKPYQSDDSDKADSDQVPKRRIMYSVEVERDWLAPYGDRTPPVTGRFSPRKKTDSGPYSYRTAYVPTFEIYPDRAKHLNHPQGPATAGTPCQICNTPIAQGAHWVHRDRHVCSPRCNYDLKRKSGIKTTGRRPEQASPDTPQQPNDHRAVPGEPCRICHQPISRTAPRRWRRRHVCGTECNRQLEDAYEQGELKDTDPLAHPDGPATGGDRCTHCRKPITKTVPWQHRDLGVCSRACATDSNSNS